MKNTTENTEVPSSSLDHEKSLKGVFNLTDMQFCAGHDTITLQTAGGHWWCSSNVQKHFSQPTHKERIYTTAECKALIFCVSLGLVKCKQTHRPISAQQKQTDNDGLHHTIHIRQPNARLSRRERWQQLPDDDCPTKHLQTLQWTNYLITEMEKSIPSNPVDMQQQVNVCQLLYATDDY